MSDTETQFALDAALSAVSGHARRAAFWSLIGPLLWIAQAVLIAAAVSALIGQTGLEAGLAALGIALLAILRAGAEARALHHTQMLSAHVRQKLRANLAHVSLRRAQAGAVEDAARLAHLIAEGVSQIGPWVERYRPAALRARVLPVIIVALVATQSWVAALALLICGPLIPLFMALVGWAAETAARAQLVEQGALNRLLIDRVAALGDIRLLGAGASARADLEIRADDLRIRTMAVLRLAFLSSAVLEFFASLGVAMVAVHMGLSLLGYTDWGNWTGQIGAFGAIFVLLIAPDFFQPLRDLAAAWHDRAGAKAAAHQIDRALEGHAHILGQGGAATAGAGTLRWHGLCSGRLRWPDGHLSQGEAVALTGPSGSGKTSLLQALAGLRRVEGQIELGGVTLNESTADACRAAMAFIPQYPRFPDLSLRDWLAAGEQVTGARIAQALEGARARSIVETLPEGLDTRLGETGAGVSGGEARRLLIARALIAAPAIVLADEPTADLDPDSAAHVTEALLALRAGGTALLVATHDPALAARLDRHIDLEAPNAPA